MCAHYYYVTNFSTQHSVMKNWATLKQSQKYLIYTLFVVLGNLLIYSATNGDTISIFFIYQKKSYFFKICVVCYVPSGI